MDHKHFKVLTERYTDYGLNGFVNGWRAFVPEIGVWGFGNTKKVAIDAAKALALPLSVRGLLCPGRHGTGCNTKLGRIDDINWLKSMIRYLENPPARKILQGIT